MHAAVERAGDATDVHVCCMYRIILILRPNSEDLKLEYHYAVLSVIFATVSVQ